MGNLRQSKTFQQLWAYGSLLGVFGVLLVASGISSEPWLLHFKNKEVVKARAVPEAISTQGEEEKPEVMSSAQLDLSQVLQFAKQDYRISARQIRFEWAGLNSIESEIRAPAAYSGWKLEEIERSFEASPNYKWEPIALSVDRVSQRSSSFFEEVSKKWTWYQVTWKKPNGDHFKKRFRIKFEGFQN